MTRTLLTLAFILLSCSFCWAQSFNGVWNGAINVNGSKFTLVFHFDNKKCTIDTPNQGVKNIPTDVIFISSDSISINAKNIQSSFSGRKQGKTIIGTFTQMGRPMPLTLSPGNVTMKRPQTPKGPFNYYGKNFTFTNPKDGTQLAGTLTMPIKYNSKTPIVILVSGKGLQNRDLEFLGHKPFLVIADYLAKHGIGAFRYDDRSAGMSKGNATKATTETFASDAEAAVKFLKHSFKFTNIGILGHEEGGTISIMVGNKGLTNFAITLATPARQGKEILLNQNYNMLSVQKMPHFLIEKYCNALEKIIDLRAAGVELGNPDERLQEIKTALNTSIPDYLGNNLKNVMKNWSPWLDFYVKYDPAEDIKKIQIPVLSMYGEKDKQIHFKTNMQEFIDNLPENANSKVRSYPDLNHMFQHCATGNSIEYGEIEETISPEILENITTWIKSLNQK